MDRLWVSFYNACFSSAEEAVQLGWIPLEDVKDTEPYLIWGITGKTVLEAKQMVNDLSLDQLRDTKLLRDELRKTVLLANSEKESKCNLPDDLQIQFNRVAAQIQTVSICLSQLPFFKEHFQNIFNLLILVFDAVKDE